MLSRTLLRPIFTLSLSLRPLTRAASTMSQPYTLDRAHFNPDLYARLREVWFAGLEPNANTAPVSTMKRWFGMGLSKEEKDAFDEECRVQFAPALESIAPEIATLPPQSEAYEQEVTRAGEIAGPLIQEIQDAGSEREQAETLLSLVLLLDQMPRNLYRTRQTLPLVYTHYDRLAHALVRGAMQLNPNPLFYSHYVLKPVWGNWPLMPLLHSEAMQAHAARAPYADAMEKAVTEEGDEAGVKYYESVAKAEREHLEVLERFGRYPQRNQALGRQSTEEEKQWLQEGGGFRVVQEDGGQQGTGGGGKDEL